MCLGQEGVGNGLIRLHLCFIPSLRKESLEALLNYSGPSQGFKGGAEAAAEVSLL